MLPKSHRTNPHYVRYRNWLANAAACVLFKRGGAVQVAKNLGVTRQSVHRWLKGPTPMPAWAAIAFGNWWAANSKRFERPLFRPAIEEKFSELGPPGE